MPFGSVFRKFKYFNATTADGKIINLKNNIFSRIGFLILGMPHIGMRLRARKIMHNLPHANMMLDAGFGTGVYSFTIANRVDKIKAIDFAQEKVEYAKKVNLFKNIEFLRGDLCNLKFADSSFDLIICSDVLEHIKNDVEAIKEIARVLRPKGTLLLTVPFNSEKNRRTYKKYEHERPGYDIKELSKLFKKEGLRVEKSNLYSNRLTERISSWADKIASSNILVALSFYPLYLSAIIADSLYKKDYNGLFVKLIKQDN